MGKVLESYLKTNFRYLASSFPYQLTGGFEATAYQPFPWGKRTALFEIPLERGQAATGIIGDFFHRYVIHVVSFEEFQYVDFPRVRKIEDRGIQVLARIEQHVYAFDHFQLQ